MEAWLTDDGLETWYRADFQLKDQLATSFITTFTLEYIPMKSQNIIYRINPSHHSKNIV